MVSIALLMILSLIAGGSVPASSSASAQDDACGTLDAVNYPVDTGVFQLGQAFGTASPRHQGRFHTGEDWFVGRGATVNQPVRAIGRGFVTLSNPNAWGGDGGVVIIRHTLRDGATIYSQYGHIVPTESTPFPARLTCVEAGQIIGVITDVRPAPHLHFEIRVPTNANPGVADNPGAGYTREDPRLLGYRRPEQMLRNLSARLHRGYAWHSITTLFDRPAPPLVLNDNSLLVIDGNQLRRVTRDGRVLWRVTLPRPAVSLHGQFAQSFVTFADGSVARVDVENGAFGDGWRVEGFAPDMPPLVTPESRIFHTSDSALVALDTNGREVLWRVGGVPRYDYGVAGADVIGLLIDGELWTFATAGALLGVTPLDSGAALAPHPDGGLIAYTRGGLWRIDATGRWSLLHESVMGGDGHGLHLSDDGALFVTDGVHLAAYTAGGNEAWSARLPRDVRGRITITDYNGVLLIISNHGDVVAVRDSGGICGHTGIYGDDRAHIWHALSADGILRVSVGDQLMGFNWERFTGGC